MSNTAIRNREIKVQVATPQEDAPASLQQRDQRKRKNLSRSKGGKKFAKKRS